MDVRLEWFISTACHHELIFVIYSYRFKFNEFSNTPLGALELFLGTENPVFTSIP